MILIAMLPCVTAASKILKEEAPSLTIQLEPIKNVNVTVKKRGLKEREEIDNARPQGFYEYFQMLAQTSDDLTDKESAIVFLERVKEDPWEESFQTFVMFDPNDPDAGKNTRFVNGYYKVDGQLLTRDEIIIPKDTRKFCKGPLATDYDMTESERLEKAGQSAVSYLAMGATLGPVGLALGGLLTILEFSGTCLGEEKEIELDKVIYANESSPGLIGGIYSTGESFYARRDLLDRGYMTMYLFAFEPPQFHEEIGFISGYTNISIDNPAQIAPS